MISLHLDFCLITQGKAKSSSSTERPRPKLCRGAISSLLVSIIIGKLQLVPLILSSCKKIEPSVTHLDLDKAVSLVLSESSWSYQLQNISDQCMLLSNTFCTKKKNTQTRWSEEVYDAYLTSRQFLYLLRTPRQVLT